MGFNFSLCEKCWKKEKKNLVNWNILITKKKSKRDFNSSGERIWIFYGVNINILKIWIFIKEGDNPVKKMVLLKIEVKF